MGKQPTKGTHIARHSGPPSQVQAPSVHPFAVSESQAWPQEPQWLRVTFVLMHDPLQQLSLGGQTRPQAPQFATSLEVFTQVPPQQAWPVEQAAPLPHMQVPDTQLSPVLQAGLHGTSVVHVPATHS